MPLSNRISVCIIQDRSSVSGPRIVLNQNLAVEVYRCKLELLENHLSAPGPHNILQGQSTRVSLMFDVSPKTIRDIWNHRTWQRATCHLWGEENVDIQAHPRAGQRRAVKMVRTSTLSMTIISEISIKLLVEIKRFS
jgi:hypothetical protein